MDQLKFDALHNRVKEEILPLANKELRIFLDELEYRKPTESTDLLQVQKDLSELVVYAFNKAIDQAVRSAVLAVSFSQEDQSES